MKKILIAFCLIVSTFTFAQMPKSGTYYYKIRFAESSYSHIDEGDCKVMIEGDSIKIISLISNVHFPFKNGEVIDEGIIMKHKGGSWIIGRKESDKELDEVGGCTDGPNEIDFEKQIFWMC